MSTAHEELCDQYAVALSRKTDGGDEKSYTAYLYGAGLDKILKKCGEETFEAVIAMKGDDLGETVGELNDVLYHVTVLLCHLGVTMDAVLEQLNVRCQSQGKTVDELFEIIRARQTEASESSYTAYLFQQGMDKILKKVGEACSLLLIAAKGDDLPAVAAETANLMYHLFVMMICGEIPLTALTQELERRSQKTGNKKTFHVTDQTT